MMKDRNSACCFNIANYMTGVAYLYSHWVLWYEVQFLSTEGRLRKWMLNWRSFFFNHKVNKHHASLLILQYHQFFYIFHINQSVTKESYAITRNPVFLQAFFYAINPATSLNQFILTRLDTLLYYIGMLV